jgi:hypothetical protein
MCRKATEEFNNVWTEHSYDLDLGLTDSDIEGEAHNISS